MMADKAGKFLFEIRPDVFPEGYLTEGETALWAKYYENRPKK